MKKIISIFTIIVILIGIMPINSSANADFVEFEFETYDDSAALIRYNGYLDENVVIPETYNNLPVSIIGDYAFSKNTVIKSVTIPNTVTYIGNYAFMGCTALESVTFPENLENIHEYAFFDCLNLKSVSLPNKMLNIYSKALGYYSDVKSGETFKISNFTINGFTNSIAEKYATENEFAFVSMGVAPLYLYEVEETYGEEAPRARILKYLGSEKDVVIPSQIDGYTIDNIWRNAFDSNEYIETVIIPGSVISIYDEAFAGCPNLKKVTFKSEYISIGEKTFYNCAKLADFKFEPDLPYFDPLYDKVTVEVEKQALEGTAYYNNNFKNNVLYFETALIKVNTNIESIIIPEYIYSISGEAFKDCTKLTSITIPKNVSIIASNAFEGCSALNNVIFDLKTRCYIEDYAFLNCEALKSVMLPENVYPCLHSAGYNYGYIEERGYYGYIKQPGFRVYGVSGSEAENFATRNGFEFLEYDFSSHVHSYDNACDTNCNTCGATRITTHKFAVATCTKAKICTVCNLAEGKALGHKYSNNCDKNCDICNATRTVGSHKYDNNCDTKCNVCNAVRKIAHTYKITTTKATLKKNGKIVKTCSVCGKAASSTTVYYPKTVKIAKTTYTYTGKAITPAITVKGANGKAIAKTNYTVTYAKGRKNVGTYKVTVTFKGNYSGTKTFNFTINPVKTTVNKLTAGKKSLKVTVLKKTKQVTGYEIQYATNKAFKSAKKVNVKSYKTTTVNLTKLTAKKTYYVRVRSYKTVDGKKYYSAWSKAKNNKTK